MEPSIALEVAREELKRIAYVFPEIEGTEIRVSNRMTVCAGKASMNRRTGQKWITLSLVVHQEGAITELRDTIRHEIAHIIAFGYGDFSHGEVWRRVVKKIGGSGQRTHKMQVAKRPARIFKIICNACGEVLGTQNARRKPSRWKQFSHKGCGGSLRVEEVQ